VNFKDFIQSKTQLSGQFGFDPEFMPDFLFGFQRELVSWSCRKGRSAIFADCGLGKTPMQLVWSENIFRKEGRPVLILTPLAVGYQTSLEGEKFGIECSQSRSGKVTAPITITNYQQLHKFDPEDFCGVVCDESSILKNFDGVLKSQITDFMSKLKYRLLCTATAAPNDYIELGTSSEAVGDLGFQDMLSRFFKKATKTASRSDEFRAGLYRFRGHAERDFWRWICSWARAIRKPSDLGFSDAGFELPPLQAMEHIVRSRTRGADFLFDMPAVSLAEQRQDRRRTIVERCELAATFATSTKAPVVSWCHLNDEGKMLTQMIPGSVEVSGSDDDEFKEETFAAFAAGEIRALVTKPVIAGFGMNWQHCAHQTFFPSHSFEQWYQAIRRSWRFGQKNPVRVDMIASEGEAGVLANLKRKSDAADKMFQNLCSLISNELSIPKRQDKQTKTEIPSWL
jgi:hypothetical protein